MSHTTKVKHCCPKCGSNNLHTAYSDDEDESLSCEWCEYSGDIKEFVQA